MKIILKEDVKSLGKKGDVVTVSDGYARNMLLPRKLGVEATPGNLKELKQQNLRDERIAQETLEAAKAFAVEVDRSRVTIPIKTGEEGRVFGSVSAKEIAEAAAAQLHMDLDKKKIVLDGPIKSLGVTEVQVKLHPKVTAHLSVEVVAE